MTPMKTTATLRKIESKNQLQRSEVPAYRRAGLSKADGMILAGIRAAFEPGIKASINHRMTLQEVLAQEVGRHGA